MTMDQGADDEFNRGELISYVVIPRASASITASSGTPTVLQYSLQAAVSSNWVFYPKLQADSHALGGSERMASMSRHSPSKTVAHPLDQCPPDSRNLYTDVPRDIAHVSRLASSPSWVPKGDSLKGFLRFLKKHQGTILSLATTVGTRAMSNLLQADPKPVHENTSTLSFHLQNISLDLRCSDPEI